MYKVIDIGLLTAVMYSGFFRLVDRVAGGSPYQTLALTLMLFVPVSSVESVCLDYYDTFVIDERYGLNRSTGREFAKDETVGQLSSAIVSVRTR